MNLDALLEEMIVFINEARGEQRNELLQQSANKIMTYYVMAKRTDKEPFLSLKQALGDDLELYLLLLSTLHFITKDAACIEAVEEVLLHPGLDLYVACNVCFQLSNIRFRDISIPQSYRRQREINRFLLERYEKENPMQVPFLPYEKRNKKRIVIGTDVLINELHAPTRLVLDTCRTLIKDLGWEVLILVNTAWMELEWMNNFWMFPYLANYRRDTKGGFSISYEDVTIRGYQLVWHKESAAELSQLMRELYEWKPFCIWNIGGISFRHDWYHSLTTVLSMPCVDGYSVSEAPVLVSYMQSSSEKIKEQLDYAGAQGQKTIHIDRIIHHKEQGKNYKKSDFEIPEDGFVISIVGTRLDDEMSEDFIQMLCDLEKQIEGLYFLIIGISHKKPFLPENKDKVKYLGFREDLVDVIKVSDLFVNPPRQGGGGGAVRAFSVDVPVITLPNCDVSNVVGEEFCCENLEKMKEEIIRYICDAAFYEEQKAKAKEKYAKRLSISNAKSYEMMFGQLEEWLEKGEIM